MALYEKEIDNGEGEVVKMRFHTTTDYFGVDVDGKEAVVQIPKKEFIEFICSVPDIVRIFKKDKEETIVASAINIVGLIIVGERHNDCIEKYKERDWSRSNKDVVVPQSAQGFYTSKHRRVDRYEAMNIAIDAGQVKGDKYIKDTILFSEDLR